MSWPTRAVCIALTACAAVAPLGCSEQGVQVLATIDPRSSPGDGGSIDGESCAPRTFPIFDVGLDILFIVDRSESMSVSDANYLAGLFRALGGPESDAVGLGMGLLSFPRYGPLLRKCLDDCTSCDGCNICECYTVECGCSCNSRDDTMLCQENFSCFGHDYQPDVPISPVPVDITQWMAALAQRRSGPPILRPALEGSLQYIHKREMDNPGRRTVPLVIAGASPHERDREEVGCDDSDEEDCAEILASAKPKTYVVAFEADSDDFDELNWVAAGGRTGPAIEFDLDRGPTNPITRFLGLIRRIRAAEGQCEYFLQPPPNSGSLNYDRLNLTLVTETEAQPSSVTFRQVPNSDACQNGTLGWYYDNASRPTRILACEDTCAAIHAEPSATVTLSLGCETLKAPSRRP